MSSTLDSLPTNPQSATPTIAMPSMRSMWGRLLWKDAREVVPIWVTLLFAAMLCLVVTWAMVNHGSAHIAPLYISSHTFIGLCSLITGVYLFANEDENRTLHLLRNLPLPPKQIVWQKLLLGSLGILCLSCLIAAFTMLLASIAHSTSPLGANSSYGFSVANILLLPLLWLVIASLSAMISRSHFYGVLIAGAITAAVIAILEPTWLGARVADYDERGGIRWLWVAMALVGGGCVMVLKATHWVEEKVVAELPLKSSGTKTSSTGKLSSSLSPNPFPVLLWQSMRQSRVLLACCFGATITGWLAIMAWFDFNYRHDDPTDSILATQKTAMTLLWMLGMMSLFASSIFLDDKRRGNFLFFQQNLERPKWFWLSRLLPFWCLALLLTMLWNFFIFDLGPNNIDDLLYGWDLNRRQLELFNSIGIQAASQSFLVPLLGLLGIIGIGQYFSMFVRNPILSFVFTGIVSVVFVLLTAYVVYVNESVWWFVIPTLAAIYLATWWRVKSWLATSPLTSDFLIPIGTPAIVGLVVAASFIHHRATEFDDVKLDVDNFAALAGGGLRNLHSRTNENGTKYYIDGIETGTEAQRQQAAMLYRDAAELWQGNHSLDMGVDPMPWPAEKTANYVGKNLETIAKIIEASRIPACDPFLSADPEVRARQVRALLESALVNSQHELLEGNLSDAKRSIDSYDRVLQRSKAGITTRYQSGYYGFLAAWADHPDQKLDSIKSAIAQLEGAQSEIAPPKVVGASGATIDLDSLTASSLSRTYREFGGERAFMNMQYEIRDLQQNNPNHDRKEFEQGYRLMPWEYQRMLKVAQLWALQKLDRTSSNIALQSMRNGRVIKSEDLEKELARHRYLPRIPIDEDRTGFPHYFSQGYWEVKRTIEGVNWRRYTLLRLGLAAYKIEHDQYPTDLIELKTYYQYGLPKTTDGLMFGWFKDGLGTDLIDTAYEAGDPSKLESADLIADGNTPLLFRFSIDRDNPLPDAVEYADGKLGIEGKLLTSDRNIFVPNRHFSRYKLPVTVGGQPSEATD